MNQVITIHPDGGVSSLERKCGQGVDVKAMGHAHVERSSLIEWDDIDQLWEVRFLTGRFEGRRLTWSMWREVLGEPEAPHGSPFPLGKVAQFGDYDDAVRAEVAFLDALRVQGCL